MGTFFKFENKFGWSELAATTALILSGAALYQGYRANSPEVTIATLPVRAYHSCNEHTKKWNVVAIIPFRLTNIGGRATTFVEVLKDPKLPPFEGVSVDEQHRAVWSVLVVPDGLAKHAQGIDAPSWDVSKIIDSSKRLFMEVDSATHTQPTILDISLGPGETKIFSLAVRTDTSAETGESIGRYVVNLVAGFSNGQKIPLQAVIEKPFVGRYLPSCK